jgi:hypothetical protein
MRRGMLTERIDSGPETGELQILTDGEKQKLAGSVFRHVVLDGGDFSNADLRNATFQAASLTRCSFDGADLRGVRFVACDLRSASFNNAIFECTRFDGTLLAGAQGISEADRLQIIRGGGSFVPECSSGR